MPGKERGIHILIVVLHDSSTQSGRAIPLPLCSPPSSFFLWPRLNLPPPFSSREHPAHHVGILLLSGRREGSHARAGGALPGHVSTPPLMTFISCPAAQSPPAPAPLPSFIFSRPFMPHAHSRLPRKRHRRHLPSLSRFHCHPGSPPITVPLILRAGGQRWMSSEPERMSGCGG